MSIILNDSDYANMNSESEMKSLSEKKPVVGLTFAANLSQNDADEEKNKKRVDDENEDNYSSEDAIAGSLSISTQLSQVDFGDGGVTHNLQKQVEWLLSRNKKLSEGLNHSRKRCRELIKELREERAKKKIKSDDFVKIQKLLNKYI